MSSRPSSRPPVDMMPPSLVDLVHLSFPEKPTRRLASKEKSPAIGGAVGQVRKKLKNIVQENAQVKIPRSTTYIVIESPDLKRDSKKDSLAELIGKDLIETGWNLTFREGMVELNSINTITPKGNKNNKLHIILEELRRYHPEGTIKFYEHSRLLHSKLLKQA